MYNPVLLTHLRNLQVGIQNLISTRIRRKKTRLIDRLIVSMTVRITLCRQNPTGFRSIVASRLGSIDLLHYHVVHSLIVGLDAVRVVERNMGIAWGFDAAVDATVTDTEDAQWENCCVLVLVMAGLDEIVLVDEMGHESCAPETAILTN